MDSPAPFIIVWIILIVFVTVISRAFDTGRVKNYIEGRGGRMLEKHWTPFGRGWYGDHNRIYEVRYLDGEGNEHRASCKTNAFSGVYFTDDEIVSRVKSHDVKNLEAENERLRAEIERLKRRAGTGSDEA